MMECKTHHICECKAKKLADLQTENRQLKRELEKLGELSADVKRARAFVRAARKATDDMYDEWHDFVEDFSD